MLSSRRPSATRQEEEARPTRTTLLPHLSQERLCCSLRRREPVQNRRRRARTRSICYPTLKPRPRSSDPETLRTKSARLPPTTLCALCWSNCDRVHRLKRYGSWRVQGGQFSSSARLRRRPFGACRSETMLGCAPLVRRPSRHRSRQASRVLPFRVQWPAPEPRRMPVRMEPQ